MLRGYHRLWRIKTDFGMTGSKRSAGATNHGGATTPKTPRSGGKRGRPSKTKAQQKGDAEVEDDEEDTPSKRIKSEHIKHEEAGDDGKVNDGEVHESIETED